MTSGKAWAFFLALFGLISVAAIPKYAEHSAFDRQILKENIAGRVKSALVLAMADVKSFPTLSVLASYVQADKLTVEDDGILVWAAGEAIVVPTYKDRSCTIHTVFKHDAVLCVGKVP